MVSVCVGTRRRDPLINDPTNSDAVVHRRGRHHRWCKRCEYRIPYSARRVYKYKTVCLFCKHWQCKQIDIAAASKAGYRISRGVCNGIPHQLGRIEFYLAFGVTVARTSILIKNGSVLVGEGASPSSFYNDGKIENTLLHRGLHPQPACMKTFPLYLRSSRYLKYSNGFEYWW